MLRNHIPQKSILKYVLRFFVIAFFLVFAVSSIKASTQIVTIADLTNAFRAYVTPTPVIPTKVSLPPAPVSTQTANVSDAQVLASLKRLLSQKDIQDELRGPTGLQGPAGTSTSGGSSAGISDRQLDGIYRSIENKSKALAESISSKLLNISGDATLNNILPQTTGSLTAGVTTTEVATDLSFYADQQKFIAVGADGFVRFVYWTNDEQDLHFVQCLDDDCETKNDTLVASTTPGNMDSIILLMGHDDLPRIVYTAEYDTVHYVQCTNADCSDNSDNIVDDTGSYYEDGFALDSNDLPSIVYNDFTNDPYELKLAQCSDQACASPTTSIIATYSGTSEGTVAIQIGSDTFPRVSYVDRNTEEIHFIQCTSTDCSSQHDTVVSSGNGYSLDMTLASDHFVRIVNNSNTGVKFIQCTNADCSENNLSIIEDAYSADPVSIVMGSDNFPRLAYDQYDGSAPGEYYVQCTNADCSEKNINALTSTNSYPSSMILGLDGFARIIYGNSDDSSLILARLGTEDGGDILTGSSIGNSDTPFGNIFGARVNAEELYLGGSQFNTADFVSPWITSGDDISFSGGKVGIGTATPATALDVNGVLTMHDNILFTDTASVSSNVALNLVSNNNGAISLITHGNQGIDLKPASGIRIYLNSEVSGSTFSIHNSQLGSEPGVFNISPATRTFTFGGASESSELWTLKPSDSDGDVFPANLLIRGSNPTPSSSKNGGNIWIAGGTPTGSGTYGNIVLGYDGTTANGNVGIGTINPQAKLDVAGDIKNLLSIANKPQLLASTSLGSSNDFITALKVVGNYAYSVDKTNNEFYVIDISNPSAPTQIGSLSIAAVGGETTDDLYISGHYAYVSLGSGTILVIDISNPANPVQIATSSALSVGPRTVDGSGHYLYLTGYTDLMSVVDISNPLALKEVATLSLPGVNGNSIKVHGHYVYIGSYTNPETLSIVDISNPLSPVLSGSANTGGAYGYGPLAVSDHYAYISTNNQIQILDISNPSSPVTVGSFGSSSQTYGLYISGSYLYVGDAGVGRMQVYDLSSPAAPVLVSQTENLSYGFTVASPVVSGKHLYAISNLNSGNFNTFAVFTIPGTETSSLVAQNASIGQLQVQNDLGIGGQLNIGTSLNVEGGISSNGALAITSSVPSYFGGSLGLGTTNPEAKLEVAGSGCFDTVVDTHCTAAGTAGDIYYGTAHANWTDIAEKYPSLQSLNAGDVVMIDTSAIAGASIFKPYITLADGTNTTLGIISTHPGMTLGDDYGKSEDYSLTLAGRVPVNFSNENGEVLPGDHLTLSLTKPGLAMKQTTSGNSIGIALQSSTNNTQVLTLVNLNYQQLNLSLTDASVDLTPDSGLLSGLVDWFANVANGITDFFANRVHTKTLCVGVQSDETCISKSQLDQILENGNVTPQTPPPSDSGSDTTPPSDSGDTTPPPDNSTPPDETVTPPADEVTPPDVTAPDPTPAPDTQTPDPSTDSTPATP